MTQQSYDQYRMDTGKAETETPVGGGAPVPVRQKAYKIALWAGAILAVFATLSRAVQQEQFFGRVSLVDLAVTGLLGFLIWTAIAFAIAWVVITAWRAMIGKPAVAAAPVSGATKTPAALSDTKVCPDCAETVQSAARVCRFCRHDFTADAAG